MKMANKGKVVCCPKCGTCATISEVGMDRFVCKNKNCNAKFGGWVVSGFVVTFEDFNSDEDYLDKFDACRDKLKLLSDLSE